MTRVVAAAVLIVVATAGCSVPVERSARVQSDDAVPFQLLDEDAPALVPAPSPISADAPLCFVSDRTVVTVVQPVEGSGTPLDVARALASPPAQPPGLTTAIVDDSLVRGVEVTGGVAHVDLSQSVATSGSEAQLLVVAQLVCTLTALPGVGQVAFRLDGAPVQVPRPDGSLAPGPVARDDYVAIMG